MAKLIKVDGTIEEVLPDNGRSFSLGELYRHTGSELVEILPLGGVCLVVDEEGMLKGRRLNGFCTNALGHPIVGDVLACELGELD